MIKKYTVSNENVFEAWPDIEVTADGRLICVYTECTHHRDRTASRIVMRKSDDRGRTWSDRIALTEETPKNNYYNNSRISRLSDGVLCILCDRITDNENKSSTVYMWLSYDNGESWGDKIKTPACGIVPDKLKELKSGRWLLTSHFLNENSGKLEQYTWYSDNKGASWSKRITVAADERYNLCEASVLELENGVLVAFMRENSMKGYDCFKAISYDEGETWNGVYQMPIPCCHRPVAGFLDDGTIMITHRFLQGGPVYGARCQNTFAAFTDTESVLKTERNEQSVRIMPLDFDRNSVPDTGYTGWVQFKDGEIYVVNYIKDDASKCQIRGYSFYKNDTIIEGDDKYGNSK